MSVENTMLTHQQRCFQIKTSFSSCTVLQLLQDDLSAIARELSAVISRAPHFFQDTPIIIDLEKINQAELLDFVHLKQVLLSHQMVPMGVRGGSKEQQCAARIAGLPLIYQSSVQKNTNSTMSANTKIISHPVRSGVQLYARDADLIIIGAVSYGAEIMADGHIHVYGTLRGRAMAGVHGNKQARIFCRQLEAELISIAGYYLTKDDIDAFSKQQGMMQIYLVNDQVKIEAV